MWFLHIWYEFKVLQHLHGNSASVNENGNRYTGNYKFYIFCLYLVVECSVEAKWNGGVNGVEWNCSGNVMYISVSGNETVK